MQHSRRIFRRAILCPWRPHGMERLNTQRTLTATWEPCHSARYTRPKLPTPSSCCSVMSPSASGVTRPQRLDRTESEERARVPASEMPGVPGCAAWACCCATANQKRVTSTPDEAEQPLLMLSVLEEVRGT